MRTEEAQAVEAQLKRRGAEDDPRTLALYLATRGEELPAALQLATRELETRADVFTLDAAGWAWMANGDVKHAWDFAQRALHEGTQDARLFLHAGIIAAAAGQGEKAAAYLATAAGLQRMLLPSERKILVPTQPANSVFAYRRQNPETTQPTAKEK